MAGLGWQRQNEKAPVPPQGPVRGTGAAAAPEMSTLEQFKPEAPRRSFNDLIVPPRVRERIEAAMSRVRYHDVLFHEWNLKKIDPDRSGVAINLFGPPGTGKTFCAEAVAHFLKKRIIRVNYAEIESKYVGETPKNITAAFDKAREADAVLFFDESDSILGKRLTNITQSADHSVNVSRAVMLTQLDKFTGVVIFATNLARNYDGAFVRRILAHIEFEMPDEDCRRRLWRLLLPSELPVEPAVDVEWLTRESAGLSGGELVNVVIASASRAVQREGRERRVLRDDISDEIAAVRLARNKVGAQEDPNQMTTQREVVRLEDLPPDIRSRFEQVTARTSVETPSGDERASGAPGEAAP